MQLFQPSAQSLRPHAAFSSNLLSTLPPFQGPGSRSGPWVCARVVRNNTVALSTLWPALG